MQARTNHNTSKVPRMSDAFPQAVIAGNYIFVSGTPGLDPATGKIISEDFEQQTRQCFLNIKAILEDAGATMDNVVKTTVFMVTGNDFSMINKIYGEFWPDISKAPARSTPQVMPFPVGILVSIECIAML